MPDMGRWSGWLFRAHLGDALPAICRGRFKAGHVSLPDLLVGAVWLQLELPKVALQELFHTLRRV